jgi:hypothetical protein
MAAALAGHIPAFVDGVAGGGGRLHFLIENKGFAACG